MPIRNTDETRFDADVASAPEVIVKFTGTWCPPCKLLQPTLESIVRDRAELLVLSVNVDDEQNLAQRYGVRAIPTMISFRNGKPSGQLVGNQSRTTIEKMLA